MTIVGGLELVAWVLSAAIAWWLVADMIAVSRRHGEQVLINPGEHMPAEGGRDAEGASRHEHG